MSSSQARNGRPATGASGLGTSSTTPRRRVPRPPARTIASSAAMRRRARVHRGLDQRAHGVADELVALLDARRLRRGHLEADVAERRQRLPAGAVAGEADHPHAPRARRLDRAQDVRGMPGGADREQHVAGLAQRLHLAGEDVVVAVVVADRGEDAAVGGERDGGQSRAIVVEPAHQLPGPVLGVGRAAAVAGDQQAVATAQRVRAQPDRGHDAVGDGGIGGHRLEVGDGLAELCGDHVPHGTLQATAPVGLKWKSRSRPPSAASARDRRTRSQGSHTNIMKPPPPAPETLVATAPLARATASTASSIGLVMLEAMRFLASQPACRVRAKAARSPLSRASFICTASAFSACMASTDDDFPLAALRDCSSMMRADSRETPVKYSTTEASSSASTQSFMRSGFTITRSSRWNSMKLKPPNAAAYWSCLPPASARSWRSIS